jgi:hypothetical protein
MASFGIIILLFGVSCEKQVAYAVDVSDMNGTWIPPWSYQYTVKNPDDTRPYYKKECSWGSGKRLVNTTIEVDLGPDDNYFLDSGFGIYKINKVVKTGEYQITAYVYSGDKYDPDYLWNPSITFHFVDKDTVWIEYTNISGAEGAYDDGEYWHRVSGPAAIPKQNGTMNDNRVRLRAKPGLKGDTLSFLNTGDTVVIIDKSPEKQQIDGMHEYWYKVQTDNRPDGWVYGKYITIH